MITTRCLPSQLGTFACRLAALFMLLALTTNAHATIHVFLQGGQSNGDGRGILPGTLPSSLQGQQADVPFYYAVDGAAGFGEPNDGGHLTLLEPGRVRSRFAPLLGPEVTFGRSMADFYAPSGDQVAIIKFASGGTLQSIHWAADGTAASGSDGVSYRGFQTTVANGMAALQAAYPAETFVIEGMIWMQGESDATSDERSNLYEGALNSFLTDIRANYGANLPFVLGRLSTNQTDLTENATETVYFSRVRDAQTALAAADPFVEFVDTDSFSVKSDGIHFDNPGQQALGYAFAAHMQALVGVPEPSAIILLGFAGPLMAYSRGQRAG